MLQGSIEYIAFWKFTGTESTVDTKLYKIQGRQAKASARRILGRCVQDLRFILIKGSQSDGMISMPSSRTVKLRIIQYRLR